METNTFHITFDEITINLYDVQQLLGLQITRNACSGLKLSKSDAISLHVEALGVSTDVAKGQLSQKRNNVKLSLSWLSNLFIAFGDIQDN